MDRLTLTMNSAILIFCSLLKKELLTMTSSDSGENLFSIKNEISKLLNPVSVLVYPLFHSFLSCIYIIEGDMLYQRSLLRISGLILSGRSEEFLNTFL